MKNLPQFLIMLFFVAIVFSCNSNNKITYHEKDLRCYEDSAASFIIWLIQNDSSKVFIPELNYNKPNEKSYNRVLSSTFAKYDLPLKMLTDNKSIRDSIYFSKIDTNFLKYVFINKIDGNIIDKNLINLNVSIIDGNETKNSDSEQSSYSQFTLPIFSKDFNMVTFEVNKFCYPQCGYGELFYYKRTQIGWELLDQKITWIN